MFVQILCLRETDFFFSFFQLKLWCESVSDNVLALIHLLFFVLNVLNKDGQLQYFYDAVNAFCSFLFSLTFFMITNRM